MLSICARVTRDSVSRAGLLDPVRRGMAGGYVAPNPRASVSWPMASAAQGIFSDTAQTTQKILTGRLHAMTNPRDIAERDRLPKNITDPSGSIIGALVGMAGTLGLLTKWEISADQAASFLGFAFMIAAAIRAWLIQRPSPSPPQQD